MNDPIQIILAIFFLLIGLLAGAFLVINFYSPPPQQTEQPKYSTEQLNTYRQQADKRCVNIHPDLHASAIATEPDGRIYYVCGTLGKHFTPLEEPNLPNK